MHTRSNDRAARWRRDVARAASYFLDRASTPESRAEIEAAYEAALAEGPDFCRYRRGSQFMEAPQVTTDRNVLARIAFLADALERRTWAVRAKGKHGGVLGRSGLTVLRVLLFVVSRREGRLYPSLETLARLARMSVPTVVSALKRLAIFGFVTVYRRIKRIRTALGIKVVQDSNAYTTGLPSPLGALGTSDLNKLPPRTGIDSERGLSSQRSQEWGHDRTLGVVWQPRAREATPFA